MFDPRVLKIPRGRAWQYTPVFLPEESRGQRSLAGYSPCSRKESDTEATEQLYRIVYKVTIVDLGLYKTTLGLKIWNQESFLTIEAVC